MKLRVVSVAEQELIEAVDYYNQQRAGLGYELAAEVAAAFDRIAQYPTAWASFSPSTRRCQVHRFPYGILYHIINQDETAFCFPGSACSFRIISPNFPWRAVSMARL